MKTVLLVTCVAMSIISVIAFWLQGVTGTRPIDWAIYALLFLIAAQVIRL